MSFERTFEMVFGTNLFILFRYLLNTLLFIANALFLLYDDYQHWAPTNKMFNMSDMLLSRPRKPTLLITSLWSLLADDYFCLIQ